MNRMTVILLAALDAVIALGVGVAIPLVPLTAMWGVQSGLTSDWAPFWRAAGDIWLLGHGVDVTVTLDPTLAASFGLDAAAVFTVSIAALGFALLTVLFGVRTGRRAWATPHPVTAVISGVATFAVLSTLVTLSAHVLPVVPSLLQGALLPGAVFALGIGVGLVAAELRHRAGPETAERDATLSWPAASWSPATRALLAAALRSATAAVTLLVAAAAVTLTLLMVFDYARITGLYQSLHPGIVGAAALTLAQLAFVPNAVLWVASWLAGPGFAIGTGSSVDVTQTSLGPLPSVPLFGVLPQGDPGFGLIAVLVPVLCAAVAGVLVRRRLDGMPAPRSASGVVPWGPGRLALVALGSGVVAGVAFGVLTWWSGGAIGPGRLQHAGPDPLLAGAAVAAEVLVGTAIGLAVRWRSEEASESLTLSERRARTSDVAPHASQSATQRAAAQKPVPPTSPAPQTAGVKSAPSAPRTPVVAPSSARPASNGPKASVPGTGSVTEALAWLDELDLGGRRADAAPAAAADDRHREADTEPVPVVRARGRGKGSRRP
ncbi:cell division protein PerM [Humibacter ginsenosidimutans]|uniref:cell division protein PerM n=1 Tax=Humibacter ginsenosidimutans TaxID=2599293 RepID=UPI001AEFAA8B|nr:DUF6350 family protein [Humibacter ginsenosidimutans]